MSDTFVSDIPIQMGITGALTVAVSDKRYVVPFNYELLGVYASVGVAPSGAAIIFDVLLGALQGASGSGVTIFPGAVGNPTIAIAAYDTTTLVVPTAAGDVSSYAEGPITDPSAAAAWGTGYQPGVAGADKVSGDTAFGSLTTPAVETAGSPWAQPSGSSALTTTYQGAAGDVFQLKVLQIGSGTAGSDAVVTLWLTKR